MAQAICTDEIYKRQRIASLRGAISHARCVLSERHQSVESIAIARANLVKYRAELSALEFEA